MNYFDTVLQQRPKALWKLNAAQTDVADISGYAGSRLWTTPTFVAPIVSGSAKSWLVDNGNRLNVPLNVFRIGREYQPFTLQVVALPITLTANDLGILSHTSPTSPYDGISMGVDKITFAVKFNAGTVQCFWYYPDFFRAYVIHAVYTPTHIQLWVDGEMVAEEVVPENYPASKFNHGADTNLLSGISHLTTTNKLVVDGIAGFERALSPEEIRKSVEAARDVVPMVEATEIYAGTYRDGTQRAILQQNFFGGNNPWPTVATSNIGDRDGYLRATESYETATLGQTNSGTWTGAISIDQGTDNTSIAGIKMEWNEDGAPLIQASLDGGSTYVTVTNGEMVPASQGHNPSGKSLFIKASFTGGQVNSIQVLRDLTVTIYRDNNIIGNDTSRVLQIVPASGTSLTTALAEHQPIERYTRSGFHWNGNNSYLRLFTDTVNSPAKPLRTIEFWVRPRGVSSGTGGILIDNRPYTGGSWLQFVESGLTISHTGFGAVYINSIATVTGAAFVKDRWYHVVCVFGSDQLGEFNIGTSNFIGEIAMIGQYPTALSAGQVLALYNSYFQKPIGAFVDAATITMAEVGTPYVATTLDFATLAQQ